MRTDVFFEVTRESSSSRARLGRLHTPHGIVETPSYVVVATDAEIRCLQPADIPDTKTQIAIANTYHLWRTLGDAGLNEFPGVHAAMGWDGPMMTDSGGFQVFSMGAARVHGTGKIAAMPSRGEGGEHESAVRVTDSGVYFMEEGEEHYLDAETSMRIQEQLGADITFAFDEPTSPHADRAYTEEALRRTHNWAERSLEAKTSAQSMYGIVQGGVFRDLREESAKFIGALPFAGFGIGGAFGSSFGDSKKNTFEEVSFVVPLLPQRKPRHLLGIGRIEDVFEAVAQGIDTFDCVIPTREARHGALWTRAGRYDITKGKYTTSDAPLDAFCGCPTCLSGILQRDLYGFFKQKDDRAGRLATLHNVFFFNSLLEEIRESLRENRFEEFRRSYTRIP